MSARAACPRWRSLPPDPDRLHTLRVRHSMWLARIDAKIAAVRQRQAEQERGRSNRPRPPERIVELGIGISRPPVRVQAGDCHMASKRRRPVDRDEARRLLTAGLQSCTHCRPDTQLDIIDLPRGTTPAPPRRKDTDTMNTPPPSLSDPDPSAFACLGNQAGPFHPAPVRAGREMGA
ncbi:DUF6233 domain-containing protein [Streptomyces phaeofaciens]|uniref:DUF6233 domain-containing protein n=1 Tax=Streptomyces phaeofaciens TaxID=68254 RepID=UPI0036D089A6